METISHRGAGALTVLTLAHYPALHLAAHTIPLPLLTLTHALTAALAAAITAGGPTSCDIDNQTWWKTLDRLVPDEWLGEGGPLQHRGLLHWWGLPAIALTTALTHPGLLPTALATAIAWGAWTGWVSHLAGDLIWGRAGYGHGRGIPLMLWWGHIGLGLKADGWTEHLAGALTYTAAALAALTLTGPLAPYWP